MDDNERGTSNKLGGMLPGKRNQPTGPITKQSPLTTQPPSYPPTKRFNGKPAVERLGGISVPDQYFFAGKLGQRSVAQGVFNAELNRTKQTLTLIVKIKFEFVNMYKVVWEKDKPVRGPLYQTWSDKSKRKETFITKFIKVIEDRWSYKHKLHPLGYCEEPIRIYKTAVRVESVDVGEHKIAKIHFDNDREITSSGVGPVVSTASAYRHEMTLSESDVKVDPNSKGVLHGKVIATKNYSVAAHEFGHAIGLHHINEKAADANQALDPYGETFEQRNDTMGHGGNIGLEDMWPFLVAMHYFTGCQWEAK